MQITTILNKFLDKNICLPFDQFELEWDESYTVVQKILPEDPSIRLDRLHHETDKTENKNFSCKNLIQQ